MGTTRTERAKDPGGCGGEDRGLWGSGGRLSPHNRASSSGDSRLSRGDRSGSDRHGRSGGRRDKEGAYGQRLRLGFPARSLPRVGGARVRPLSRTLRTVLYSPKCLEGEFSEVGLPISFSEVRHNLGPGVVGCSVTNELGGDHGLLERRTTAPARQGAGTEKDRRGLARAAGR